MPRTSRNLLAGLVCAALWSLVAAPAGAQCVGIAQGDVLVVNLVGTDPIVKVTDVSLTANTATNQQVVCSGGPITFPRSIDFDREGRIWVSMTDGAVRVDPNPAIDEQLSLLTGQLVPPRGIVKERDGIVFLADPGINNLATIFAVDNLNGVLNGFTTLGEAGVPLGLIFDRSVGADPRDMLFADSGNNVTGVTPGLYSINEAGGISGLARDGAIRIPFRLDSVLNSDFVYLSDIGGTADCDGPSGTEPAVTEPAQIIRINRTPPFTNFDTADPCTDGSFNQTVISSGGLFNTPIGIVVLEEDGVNPDVLLVSDAFAGGGSLIRVEFDPTSPNPDATDTQTVVATGLFFDTPWEVKIVPEIEPRSRSRIFVTQNDGSPGGTGIVYVDPDGSSGDYVTGLTTPNAIVVDPDTPADLIVADAGTGGTPSILRVAPATATTGAASTISSGGLLVEPTGLIVDSNGDIVVADRGADEIILIDGTSGTQAVLNPPDPLLDFVVNPVGVGIDPDGYLQVVTEADEGNPEDPLDDIGPRLIRINPITGKQYCFAETFLPGTSLTLESIQDIIFDAGDDSTVFSEQTSFPILRFVPNFGTVVETTSFEYERIRHTAVAENRDLISVDAGTDGISNGRLLRLDPIIAFTPGDPIPIPGSAGLTEPRGVAVNEIPRPNSSVVDTDLDGVLDPEDNCVRIPNPDQLDTNAATSNGSACEATCDVNGDGSVGIIDFQLFVAQIGNDCNADPGLDCSGDCSETPDGIVGLDDFPALIGQIGNSVVEFGGLVGVPDDVCP